MVCPTCREGLTLSEVGKGGHNSIETGVLTCIKCGKAYDIIRHVPRFVPTDNYSSTFGFEWTKHAKTQYDSYTGSDVSRRRFFQETKWPRHMEGQLVLEAGSGSGRFTEIAASTHATVVSMDSSLAADANFASNGDKDNVLIVQADIYTMPFREDSFDKIFCFGVLQHTPRVEDAFKNLVRYLKPGGQLVVDVYHRVTGFKRFLSTKHAIRPITRRMAAHRLYSLCSAYVDFMWPLAKFIHSLPHGSAINWRLLIPDYRGTYDLSEETLKEWALLDMFDMLSPAYDSPQSIETVDRWFKDVGIIDAEICLGYNGVVGRGTKATHS